MIPQVWKNAQTHSLADLVEVLEPSPERITPKCEHFGECGGCQYQFMNVGYQRRWKQQHVVDGLERIAHVSAPEVQPVIGSDEAFGYRSKLTPHHDAPDDDGEIGPIGFMRRGQRGRLVDVPQVPHCHALDK